MDAINLYFWIEQNIDSQLHLTRIRKLGCHFNWISVANDCKERYGENEWMGGATRRQNSRYKEQLVLPGYPANQQEHKNLWRSATVKYPQKLKQVLRSWLNSRKIQGINTYALAVSSHPAGIRSWPQEETDATDVMTQKLLMVYKDLHPESNTLRFYDQQKEREWKLAIVQKSKIPDLELL